MAGFTMQVQSAISPFVCTLESGQPLCCLICGTPPCRACPYASKTPKGEPNTPLAFRRHSPFGGGWSATQSSKLGTEKSLQGLDRIRKILSLELPTMTTYILLIAPQKNRLGL